MTKIIRTPSPNFNEREEAVINALVLHHTGMTSAEAAIKWLCVPNAKVSCHYLIAADGRIFHLVDEDKRAWHAGISHWRGKSDLNSNSIGIELDNIGTKSFTPVQMKSTIWLCQEILKRHPIEARNILAHADIAPNRKVDPNHHFNWAEFAQAGIGIYSTASIKHNDILFKFGDSTSIVQKTRDKLRELGYYLDNSLACDHRLINVIHAFKRRYAPESHKKHTHWDALCEARLNDLISLHLINDVSHLKD